MGGADEWVALTVGGMRADDAPASWLNAEGKDGRWQSVTAGLRASLDGLTLTADQEQRWDPVLRDHCSKIQDRVDMEHLYSELYCDQVAMMAVDLKAGRAPLSTMSGKEYQFFMYYKMGGLLALG